MLMNCDKHGKPMYAICGTSECKKLLCRDCFDMHSSETNHTSAGILNHHSVEFFIKWSLSIITKIDTWIQYISNKGYDKVFDFKLYDKAPKNILPGLAKKEVNEAAQESLRTHREVICGNLNFVYNNRELHLLTHPEFLKDLYNLLIDNPNSSLATVYDNIKLILLDKYKHKEVYKYMVFFLAQVQLFELSNMKREYLKGIEHLIIYPFSPNSPREEKFKSLQFTQYVVQLKSQEVIPNSPIVSKQVQQSILKNVVNSPNNPVSVSPQTIENPQIGATLTAIGASSIFMSPSHQPIISPPTVGSPRVFAIDKNSLKRYYPRVNDFRPSSTLNSPRSKIEIVYIPQKINQSMGRTRQTTFEYDNALIEYILKLRYSNKQLAYYVAAIYTQKSEITSKFVDLYSKVAKLYKYNRYLAEYARVKQYSIELKTNAIAPPPYEQSNVTLKTNTVKYLAEARYTITKLKYDRNQYTREFKYTIINLQTQLTEQKLLLEKSQIEKKTYAMKIMSLYLEAAELRARLYIQTKATEDYKCQLSKVQYYNLKKNKSDDYYELGKKLENQLKTAEEIGRKYFYGSQVNQVSVNAYYSTKLAEKVRDLYIQKQIVYTLQQYLSNYQDLLQRKYSYMNLEIYRSKRVSTCKINELTAEVEEKQQRLLVQEKTLAYNRSMNLLQVKYIEDKSKYIKKVYKEKYILKKKLYEVQAELQAQISYSTRRYYCTSHRIYNLNKEIASLKSSQSTNEVMDPDEYLLAQVIELEAEVEQKRSDITLLVESLNDLQKEDKIDKKKLAVRLKNLRIDELKW